MSRSGERLAIVGLVALVILLITFPAIGGLPRGFFVAVLGDTAASAVGGVANVIGVGGFLFLLVRWVWADRKTTARSPATSPSAPTTQPDDRTRRVIEDTNGVAQRLSDFATEYEKRDPYRVQPGEAMRMDFNTPEPEAEQQRKGAEYSAQMDELEERYRQDLRHEVIRIRGALADQGITDAQFDELHQNPKNVKHVDTIAARLWEMAGRLERRA